jgi:hypothetical protein
MRNPWISLVMLLIACLQAPVAAQPSHDLVAIYGGPIPSRGLITNVSNSQVVVNVPTASIPGNSLRWFLIFEGTLGAVFEGSWAREAQIMVIPPNGTPFFVQPYTEAGPPPAGAGSRFAYGIPIDPTTSAGEWTFRFVEIFDDVPSTPSSFGDDAIWSEARVYFYYGANIPPDHEPEINPIYARFTDVASGGTSQAPLTTVTWNNTRPGYYPKVQLVGSVMTAGLPSTPTTQSLPTNLRILARSPTGSSSTLIGPTAGTGPVIPGPSMYRFNRELTYTGNGAGTWRFQFFPAVDFPDVPVENHWIYFQFILKGIPNDILTELGNITTGSSRTIEQSYATDPLRFYRFTLTEDHSSSSTLGLQMFISPDAESNQVGGLALYDINGLLKGLSDYPLEPSPQTLASLSYGWPFVQQGADADRIRSDGRHGPLEAGTYFLAVGKGHIFSEEFGAQPFASAPVNPPASPTPIVIRSGLTPPQVPPANQLTLGTQTPNNTETVISYTPTTPLPILWCKLTTSSDVRRHEPHYIDIDTTNSLLADVFEPAEASLAMYSERGRLIATSIGNSFDSIWGHLSFGGEFYTSESRPPVPVLPGLPFQEYTYPRSGLSGELAAGTYYIAVTPPAGFFNGFAYQIYLDDRRLSLNIRTNMQVTTTTSPCGAADIGTEGGAAGSDSLLDNNDFIVFIDWFFQNDPLADLGSEGGASGPDQLFDNNDFIVFIDLFFSGSVSPGCNATP